MEQQDVQAYKFAIEAERGNTYLFITTNAINYSISFELTDYLFPEIPTLCNLTFEILISVEYNPTQQLPTFDERTSLTISAILKDFFNRQNGLVVLYICDSSDGKQNARERKFNSWFEKYKENEFEKIKVLLEHPKETDEMLFSVIIKNGNPYRAQIVERLERLKWEYRFGK